MFDNTSVLLNSSGQEAWYVHKGYDWNIKGIAEADKSGCLYRSVDIQDTGQDLWLVGDDTDLDSTNTGKTNDNILHT